MDYADVYVAKTGVMMKLIIQVNGNVRGNNVF